MTTKLNRVRVKVCGITQPQDARAIVAMGADALGMILHAQSPRKITVEQAQLIRAEVPAFVTLVGVFVDCPKQTIDSYVERIGLDLVQLHGDETNQFGASLSAPFIKVIRAKSSEHVNAKVNAFPDARAILLDPYVEGQHGGTGQALEHAKWPQNSTKPLILAGGLGPDNIANAVTALNPYAVDLNSGVELEPGIKCLKKVSAAIDVVRV